LKVELFANGPRIRLHEGDTTMPYTRQESKIRGGGGDGRGRDGGWQGRVDRGRGWGNWVRIQMV